MLEMAIKLTVILILMSIILPNVTQTMLMDLKAYRFSPHVIFVRSKGKHYPGMVINGFAAVTAAEANNSHSLMSICIPTITFRPEVDSLCFRALKEMIIDTNGIGYVPTFLGAAISNMIRTKLRLDSKAKPAECVAVSINHDPIGVAFTGNNVDCPGCMHMDTFICDVRYLGVLLHGNKIVFWQDMLKFVEKHIGNDNDRKMIRIYRKLGIKDGKIEEMIVSSSTSESVFIRRMMFKEIVAFIVAVFLSFLDIS